MKKLCSDLKLEKQGYKQSCFPYIYVLVFNSISAVWLLNIRFWKTFVPFGPLIPESTLPVLLFSSARRVLSS